jgi:hypothetical protein
MPMIEELIREKFESIKLTKLPKLRRFDWFCAHVCDYNKNKIGNKTVCQHYKEEIQRKGIDVVTLENADLSKISTYQDGGGRKAK